ncbi:MAG: hypothetical protein ACTSX6_12455 [Candidatus Heimdallarchaeaceae archaeon]
MTKQGQLTQKGINAQNWAAMSLFLQYVTRSDFSYIGFEGEKLEDFHLVFEDGRKIICESKAGDINLADIKEILDKTIKHAQITDQDEILIVCKNVNKNAKGLIENFKYFTKDIEKKLKSKKHKFEDKHLKLLPQLRFWEVSQDINRKAVELLMVRVLSYPEPFWIPKHRLKQLTKSIVEDKVYRGSQKGETLTKGDFLNLLKKEKILILEDDGYDYEKVKRTEEKEIKKIIKSIKSKSRKLNINNEIIKLYANPSIHHFTLIKLENEKNLILSDWENLWKATCQSAFSIELFKIFINNIKTKENQRYALDFILETLGETINYFREEFIKYDIVKLCEEILKINPSLEQKIFEVIKKVYKHSIDRFLYVKRRRDDSWEREKTAELLEKLFDQTKNNDFKLQIIKYIVSNFNLIADDGKFWHYTPPSIFKTLGKYVSSDPERLIPWFTEKCIEQYNKFYKSFGKKLEFNGWEHMGSGISQSGSEFSISDKHFVTQIISPALNTFYKEKKSKAWKFILSRCITRDAKKIKKNNPDFLNRAAIPILIKEYRSGKHSKKAFNILSDFIKMRQGIPWKNDLIFQVVNNDLFTDKQKWNLAKVSLEEFKNLPTNVFVEQIISDLAEKSKNKAIQQKAIKIIEGWAQNPEYDKRHGIGSFDMVDNIFKLLSNKQTFKKGVEILQKHLDNPTFIKETDVFDTYDVAKAVAKVIDENLKKGLELLESIYSYEDLSVNQQITFCSSIYNISDNNPERLLQVYNQFLKPKLIELLGGSIDVDKLTDIEPIEKRFNYRHSRESLVQFAEKLAKVANKEHLEAALWLVKVFIHDTDPPKDGSNYPDDPKGEFNEHKRIMEGEDQLAIRSVRGWCCHVIQKLAVPRNSKISDWTRKFIEKLVLDDKYSKKVSLMRLLAFDDNFYVRLQSCIPLEQIVRNRHTHLPGKTTRFISQEAAEEIEQIIIDMIFDKDNQKLKAVMKNLTRVFTYIRTLETSQVNKTLKIFLNSKFDDVATEITPLLIFYALFRKNAFKNWPKSWKKPGKFDASKFTLFENQLKNGRSAVRAKLAWQLERLPDEIKKSPKDKQSISISKAVELSQKYLLELADNYEHDVYNDIYRFIEEYIGDYFGKCYQLWKKCIEVESKYFKKNWSEDKLHEMYWWPFFYNGKVLVAILDNKGKKEFMAWFKKLASYPAKVLIANDLDTAVEKLIDITDKKYKTEVKNLFRLLIERNPKYYDFKQRWLKKAKK